MQYFKKQTYIFHSVFVNFMVLLGQNVSSDIEIDWDQIPKGMSRFLRNNGWLDILEIIVKF